MMNSNHVEVMSEDIPKASRTKVLSLLMISD